MKKSSRTGAGLAQEISGRGILDAFSDEKYSVRANEDTLGATAGFQIGNIADFNFRPQSAKRSQRQAAASCKRKRQHRLNSTASDADKRSQPRNRCLRSRRQAKLTQPHHRGRTSLSLY